MTGYNIYRGTSAGGESSTADNSSPVTGNSYQVTGLTDGTTYYYEVTAVNAQGEGPPPTSFLSPVGRPPTVNTGHAGRLRGQMQLQDANGNYAGSWPPPPTSTSTTGPRPDQAATRCS